MDPAAGLDPVPIQAHRVHGARPGVDRVAAPAQPVPGHLICVGVLSRHKGQDLLVEALAGLADRDWHCLLAGSLDRDPDFVEQLRPPSPASATSAASGSAAS